MYVFLDAISRIGTFLLLFGVLFFVFDFIFRVIFKLNKHIVLKRFHLNDVVSIILAISTILMFFEISSPYANLI